MLGGNKVFKGLSGYQFLDVRFTSNKRKIFKDNVCENTDGILGYQLSKAIVAQKEDKR
jgi:hypothetical protein